MLQQEKEIRQMRGKSLWGLYVLIATVKVASGVGWRGDGSGCYPEANPPTEWGPDKNIIWATNLPSWGNSTPVIVEDRLFVTSEPTDIICLSRLDGRVLWSASNSYFDSLTPEEMAKAKEMQRQAAEIRAEVQKLEQRRGELQKELNKINNLRNRVKELEKKLQIISNPEALANRLKELEKQATDLTAELAKRPNDGRLKKQAEDVATEQTLLRDPTLLKAEVEKARQQLTPEEPKEPELKKQLAELSRQIDEIRKNRLAPLERYDMPPTHNVTGYATPTVVSDGNNVFFLGGHGMAACYTLEGKRKWLKFIAKSTDGYGHSASPIIAGGYLIVQMTGLTALNPETGEVVWEAREAVRRWGTPVVTRIGGEEVIVTPNGDFVRAADGTILARRVAKLEYAAPVLENGVAYFIEERGKALKLPETLDKPFTPQVLWTAAKIPGDRYYASAAVADGLIYAVNQQSHFVVIDATTGEPVYGQKPNLGAIVYPSVTLAGKYVYVSAENGITIVLEQGRAYKEIARNKLEPFRCCPVFDGEHLYIRGLKKMYCIGKKSEKL